MFNTRSYLVKVGLVGFFLAISVAFATDYYMQDFFPIGFTGFEHTGYWSVDGDTDGSSYPDNLQQYPYGTWAKERELLERTHCNFIGCSDAWYKFDII